MSCTCLDKVRKRLSEHHEAPVELDLKQTVNTDTLEMGTDLPPLYYRFQRGKKKLKSYITFRFCPFCGTRRGGK